MNGSLCVNWGLAICGDFEFPECLSFFPDFYFYFYTMRFLRIISGLICSVKQSLFYRKLYMTCKQLCSIKWDFFNIKASSICGVCLYIYEFALTKSIKLTWNVKIFSTLDPKSAVLTYACCWLCWLSHSPNKGELFMSPDELCFKAVMCNIATVYSASLCETPAESLAVLMNGAGGWLWRYQTKNHVLPPPNPGTNSMPSQSRHETKSIWSNLSCAPGRASLITDIIVLFRGDTRQNGV